MRLPFRYTGGARSDLRAGRAIEDEVRRELPSSNRGERLRRAIEHYLRAADRSKVGSEVWLEATYSAGSLLAGEQSVRDLDRAIELLGEVVARCRGYHPAHYFLGEACAMRGDLDAAEATWRRALELDPTQIGVRDVLARLPADRIHLAASRGDHAGVVSAVERLPEAERDAECWLRYGDALVALGRVELGGEAWRRAASMAPLKGMRRRFREAGLEQPE